MRIYQGVDLVEVDRLREAWERTEGFRREVFTEAESAYCLERPDPYPHLAARFAVKEACLRFGIFSPRRRAMRTWTTVTRTTFRQARRSTGSTPRRSR